MANLYAVTDSYQLIYNPAVSGDFSGYMQSVGGNTITCKIADSLPSDDVGSFEIELGDSIETILNGYYIRVDGLVDATLNTGLQLYAKTASGDGTLSLIAPTAISVGGDPISDSNPIPTKSVATPTNKSGTISTGGTAQVLMAANSKRQGIEFYNNSSGSLWLNVVGTATAGGGSIEVRSGGYWSPSVCPVTAISVIGATTGQAFTCWEYSAINPKLALLMSFDNNWNDESGYNHTFTTANGTPNFITNAKFGSHAYKMSDGYNVYHNIKCSHDDAFDVVTLKKEWQIDFWLNLLDDGHNDTLILRKNLISNSQTSVNTSLAWSVVVTKNVNTRLDFRYMHSGGASQNAVSSLSNALNTQNVWHHCRIVSNGTQIKVFVDGFGGTAESIAGTGIVASIYDFFIGVHEGQFGGYQPNAITDELRIKAGFDTFDDFTPPTYPFLD